MCFSLAFFLVTQTGGRVIAGGAGFGVHVFREFFVAGRGVCGPICSSSVLVCRICAFRRASMVCCVVGVLFAAQVGSRVVAVGARFGSPRGGVALRRQSLSYVSARAHVVCSVVRLATSDENTGAI